MPRAQRLPRRRCVDAALAACTLPAASLLYFFSRPTPSGGESCMRAFPRPAPLIESLCFMQACTFLAASWNANSAAENAPSPTPASLSTPAQPQLIRRNTCGIIPSSGSVVANGVAAGQQEKICYPARVSGERVRGCIVRERNTIRNHIEIEIMRLLFSLPIC